MFDKVLTRIQGKSKKELDERIKRRRKLVQESLVVLDALGKVILDDAVNLDGTVLRDTLFEKVVNIQHDIVIGRVVLHVLGITSRVHEYDRRAGR